MRLDLLKMPSTLALLTLTILSTTTALPSSQEPRDAGELGSLEISQLLPRQGCANPCGWEGRLCCTSSQYCYTNSAGEAACGALADSGSGSGNGWWQPFTTTFVRTDLVTVTSIGSSFVGAATAAPTAASNAQCNYSLNESPCGPICCTSSQYCLQSGKCAPAANPGSSNFANTFTVPTGTTVGFLPPLRPTDSTLITRTTVGTTPTTTVAFLAPVATGANVTVGLSAQPLEGGGGLSPGAIAGIVLGVIFGLALLFLLCFLCCLKGLLDGVLALFGFGKKRRREREVEVREEEYVRRSRRGGSRDDRSWYGSDRPRRVVREEKTSKGGGAGKGLLGVGAGLAGLAALLGAKRSRDRKKEERSYYSSSSSSGTSDSSMSSYIPPPPRTRSRSRTVRSSSRRP
ncbi:hypothetical protein KVT40_005514 [Elsinoe batatas]|uniref:Uncharacterized protein n=1 Tax=Elsinoe batatas TaxID=2601811 RepID=A0A8K0KYY7_9PEZI|nr:hypothetical protein KVT40_005514 [Elsinoe batatas]